MAQLYRLQGQIELKCEADKFFDVWAHKIYLVQKICPDKVQKTVLNKGEWHKPGAELTGYYVINDVGESASIKTRVDEIDEKNRCVVHSYHEGYIMEKLYRSFTSKMQVTPKGKGCVITWSYEYEKMIEDAPDANLYLHFNFAMATDVDAYLCKA
ncbi:kirola-like [Amaranthus tricolor]|uniref:kirola-like n=1 Tax=Amaranthus tricolor TaxID=29722 RepID=UPI002589D8A8|nr:kirola-like [Amaranthus tricolor]